MCFQYLARLLLISLLLQTGWFSSFLFCFKISTLFAYRLIFSIIHYLFHRALLTFCLCFRVFLFSASGSLFVFPFLIVFSKYFSFSVISVLRLLFYCFFTCGVFSIRVFFSFLFLFWLYFVFLCNFSLIILSSSFACSSFVSSRCALI